MSFVHADRVKETSTTTGTGTYSLAGAVAGFRTFVAGLGTGNRCTYCVEDGTNWEINEGTITDAAPDTLTRDLLLASSTGSAISWGAGTRNLFAVYSAAHRNPVTKRLAADDTSTSVTLGLVSGLVQHCEPGTYHFKFVCICQTTDTTVGVSFNANFTGTTTVFQYRWNWTDASSTAGTGAVTQSDSTTGQVYAAYASRIKRTTAVFGTTISFDTANADAMIELEGIMIVTVAGDLELYFGSDVATGTQTLRAGSSLILTRTD